MYADKIDLFHVIAFQVESYRPAIFWELFVRFPNQKPSDYRKTRRLKSKSAPACTATLLNSSRRGIALFSSNYVLIYLRSLQKMTTFIEHSPLDMFRDFLGRIGVDPSLTKSSVRRWKWRLISEMGTTKRNSKFPWCSLSNIQLLQRLLCVHLTKDFHLRKS